MEESEKKLSKVGIVSCSGEDLPEGTISRLATLEVLHHKKPFDTTTICLPLFIAGGEGDRMFAKNHPTITVDGCEKLCAKKATEKYTNVQVEGFDGLVVNYAISKPARVVIRGLRMISDFEYEFQMALTNRKLAPQIETVFMMPKESYSYLSSKLIKEVVRLGANVSDFVPKNVADKLKEKINNE